jgi:O-methyltransferase
VFASKTQPRGFRQVESGLRAAFLMRRPRAPTIDRLALLATVSPRELVRRPDLVRLALQVKTHSMLTYPKLSFLFDLAGEVRSRGVAGDFVQCGVWRGGSAAMVARAWRDAPERHLWLLDSWAGQPPPDSRDVSEYPEPAEEGMFSSSLEDTRSFLSDRMQISPNRFTLVRGWFQQTVPEVAREVRAVALLHVDCDFYAPTQSCLRGFESLLSPEAPIVVDDYGTWRGCRQAVDEFCASHPTLRLEWIDRTAVVLRPARS